MAHPSAQNRASAGAGILKRSSTVAASNFPSSSSASSRPGGRTQKARKFSTGSLPPAPGDKSPVEVPSDDVEVLFHHPARIVSFRIPEREPGDDEIASYEQPAERTISSGFMKIYRVRFTTAFLQAGPLLQPLLPRSAGWCMDETRGIFVLRIRKDNYYRLELQEFANDGVQIEALKSVLNSIIVFEKTSCPFRPRVQGEGENFEHPAPLPVFRRLSSASAGTAQPFATSTDSSLAPAGEEDEEEEEEEVDDDDDDDESDVIEIAIGAQPEPEVEDVPAPSIAAMMSQIKDFDDRPGRRTSRFPGRQPMRGGSPGSMSPFSGRSQSQGPPSREPGPYQSMNPLYALSGTEDEDDSELSGLSSPRITPRIASLNLSTTVPSSSSAENRVTWAGVREIRGRSAEIKPLFISRLPLSPIVIPERTFVPIDAYLEGDHIPNDSPHPSPLFSRTATPVLYLSADEEAEDGDDSDSAESLHEAITPKTPGTNPYRATVRIADGFSKPTAPPRVLIRDNDPDSMNLNLRKSIMMRANSMPLGRRGSFGDYEDFGYGFEPPARSRSSRRFIRSIDHEAAREVFARTADFTIHRPSNFLLRFMLSVADRIMKGVKTYMCYWGDWKKGWVKGQGEKAAEKERVKKREREEKEKDAKSGIFAAPRQPPPVREKTGPAKLLSEMEDFRDMVAGKLRKTLQRRGTM
ncbi:hypothetical protein DRE_05435 [Drechslerella stenobrocha 248]|uniref:Inheritance of peroxisomes protein 1 n=1 Tax=Drechslerella stenobrocha 248 TaxID=1043628 RepID=W7HZE3_9PEZI|nr:hypothetical protein DRE_05435 [Drechslerella stenobrocha 248]